MLLAFVLHLQVQAALPEKTGQLSRDDSVRAARIITRARREESRLFAEWRHEWQKQRDLRGTDPRFWSLHCHFDDIGPGDEYNVITSWASRKSMCPIWFQGYGTRGDENEHIDNAIPAKSRAKIMQKRASVLALLDTAAKMDPANPWVLGQRVRLNVDQRQFARATLIASDECAEAAPFCAMLEGYVLARSNNWKGAEAAYGFAERALSPEDRCALLDASVFMEPDHRSSYEKLACEQRMPLDARFWWLADPLWIKRGNERLAVHLDRQTLLYLKSALTADEHFDYRARYGGASVAEMLLRYGWPSVSYHHLQEHLNHNGWLGFRDSASNASHEYFRPRYHSTPSYPVIESLGNLRGPELNDLAAPWNSKRNTFEEHWWPIEHFPRAGAIVGADYQAAIVRRTRGPTVAVATDPRSERLTAPMLPAYTMALVAMRDPADSARESTTPARLEKGGGVVSTLPIRPGLQVVSAEVLDVERDSAPASRARFAINAPPGIDSLAAGDVAMSDPVLFAAGGTSDALPTTAFDAFERMLPTTRLVQPRRVGVFFEMYGVQPADSMEITLTVISANQPGFLRRLGARVGVGEVTPGSFVVRWGTSEPGTAVSASTIDGSVITSRAIILNMAELKGGRYVLEIGASRAGGMAAVARREFVVVR